MQWCGMRLRLDTVAEAKAGGLTGLDPARSSPKGEDRVAESFFPHQ